MNVTIVKPSADELTLEQVAQLAEDIWEAWDYQKETGSEVNAVLEGVSKAGKLIYRKLDLSELTDLQFDIVARAIEMGDNR